MGYKFNVFLPGLDTTVSVKEVNSKQYRDLVKSLYNKDGDVFLEHLNEIIEEIVPGILRDQLSVVDYLILVLTCRMICINPDIKLTSTCTTTKKTFESVIRIEDIIAKLATLKYNKTLTKDAFTVNFSLVKGRDIPAIYTYSRTAEVFYQFVSSVDSIMIGENNYRLSNLNFKERITVIENLPIELTNKIYLELSETYKQLAEIKLILLKSPYTGTTAVEIPVSVYVDDIFALLKILYNDDLSNVYKLSYNLVSMAGYTPEYLDIITPAEQFLYWSLHLQRVNKENSEYSEKGEKNTLPTYDGLTLPTGKISRSEFTVEK